MQNIKSNLNIIIQTRLQKAKNILKHNHDVFSNNFYPNITCNNLKQKYNLLNNDELKQIKTYFSLAGRIMLIRSIGKLHFLKLQDGYSDIQLFVRYNNLKPLYMKLLKIIDIGDFIGVKGIIMKTKSKELSLNIDFLQLLTKSLRPLPNKFHGITNVEQRYRKRYLDLIMNHSSRDIFIKRTKIIREIRNFFDNKNFIEVETPILVDLAGGANAKPFSTKYNYLKEKKNLRIATELHLKRLIIGGFERVYEIGKIFRNESISTKHNPEFTTIEFYQSYATYKDFMHLTETIISNIVYKLYNKYIITYKDNLINLEPPFKKNSIINLVEQWLNKNNYCYDNLNDINSVLKALTITIKHIVNINMPLQICLSGLSTTEIQELSLLCAKYHVKQNLSDILYSDISKNMFSFYYDLGEQIDKILTNDIIKRRSIALHLLYAVFEDQIENTLIQPTFITDFSINTSPLARRKNNDPSLAERFELICGGFELANAFSELTDPIDQKKRFQKQINNNNIKHDIDNNFIEALEYGMPPVVGEGIGIDRLVMLLTNSNSIKDVILFPQMRVL